MIPGVGINGDGTTMADGAPRILVVDGARDERALIASVLREAGFAVVETAGARGAWAAMSREHFAAAVIALPDGEGIEFRRDARCRQPGLAVLGVVDRAALRLVEEDCRTLVRRPLDPRRLLDCAFELVLRDSEHESEHTNGPHRGHAAELGIAAAELAGPRQPPPRRRGGRRQSSGARFGAPDRRNHGALSQARRRDDRRWPCTRGRARRLR